jgi:hypothetical protein
VVVELDAAVVGGTCVAVGMERVGEGITTVTVGLACVVGEARAVTVFVGIARVFVGSGVCNVLTLTLNCPQAVNDNITKSKSNLFALISSPF